MIQYPEALWLNVSPSLLRFDLPIINYLARKTVIGQWEYQQQQDEASSLDIALNLLDDYLNKIPHPIHLIGHSTAGLLGLLYGRKYPEKVRSLTLLGVGVTPSVDWTLHYYILRETLSCSSQLVLARLVHNLFGCQINYHCQALVQVLEKSLETSISPHSLYQKVSFPSGGISKPLMICGAYDDPIIPLAELSGWERYLKEGDRFFTCPQGHHFFHYFQPEKVGTEIIKFWQSLPTKSTPIMDKFSSSLSCYLDESTNKKMKSKIKLSS